MELNVGYLYGDLMNIYGDTGNIITIQKRCEWRAIQTNIIGITIGTELKPGTIDIYFFGGGQDQGQLSVSKDLVSSGKKEIIKNDIEKGIPLLSICGGYQLLGEYYQPIDEERLEGINIFPAFTEASSQRMIGNILIESKDFGKLVGFENHSGKTYLRNKNSVLGNAISGFGNNGEDKTEGCMYKNAIGCYMHGSLLPKNPTLADWLIEKALEVKYNEKIKLKQLDDTIEEKARNNMLNKLLS